METDDSAVKFDQYLMGTANQWGPDEFTMFAIQHLRLSSRQLEIIRSDASGTTVFIFRSLRTWKDGLDNQNYDDVVFLLENLTKLFRKQAVDSQEPSTKKADEFMGLLGELGLSAYYGTRKLSCIDLLQIDEFSIHSSEPKDNKGRPMHVLRKTMMLDTRGRDYNGPVMSPSSRTTPQNRSSVGSIFDLDDDFDSNIPGIKEDQFHDACTISSIDAMDVMLATLHCSNNFLRQHILAKLSVCQFALPLLLPDPLSSQVTLPIWSLRNIRKQWVSASEKTSFDQFIIKKPAAVVTFIKAGTCLSTSKTTVLNKIVHRDDHEVFSYRSQRSHVLRSGVVEIAWYLPSGTPADSFKDVVAFINLRGNAIQLGVQMEYLREISNVFVVIADVTDDQQTLQLIRSVDHKPLVWLKTNQPSDRYEDKVVFCKVSLPVKERQMDDLRDKLTSCLRDILEEMPRRPFDSLEKLAQHAKWNGFRLDEDFCCVNAKDSAENILKWIQTQSFKEAKTFLFPLQQNMWHEWCRLEKEKARLHKLIGSEESVEMYKANIMMKQKELRQGQWQILSNVNTSTVTKMFIDAFNGNNDTDEYSYFILHLGYLLNQFFLEKVPALQQKYARISCELKELRSQEVIDHIAIEEKDLERAQLWKSMSSCSIDIDHFVREVAQMYECISVNGTSLDIGYWSTLKKVLPQIAVHILKAGFPVELMDGDAGSIPMTWMTAVFGELVKQLNDPRVFVVSVLGVQSSGKSTLLNMLFGINFATSAGRCTKGAYMQLIPVDPRLKNCGYDYVLVVDAEGLKSQEKQATVQSQIQDNELASLIIGLADLTIVNIFGENLTDIEGFLQIAVLTFLRMHQVKLKSKCFFVHQNVSDPTAFQKLADSRRELQEKLDSMTKYAAKTNLCEHTILSFNDVLSFDIDEDVWYFPGLWKGTPPNAPPNNGYSEKGQELRAAILTVKFAKSCMRISQLRIKLSDLWNAVLHENFTFSFRNTLEICEYQKLEKCFMDWTWSIRQEVMKWQQRARNIIMNEENVEVDLLPRYERDLNKTITPIVSEVDTLMHNYFQHADDFVSISQWQEDTKQKVLRCRDALLEESMSMCKTWIGIRSARLAIDQQQENYQKELVIFLRKIMSAMKNMHLSHEQQVEYFNNGWEMLLQKISNAKIPESKLDIANDVQKQLFHHFNTYREPLLKKLEENSLSYFEDFKFIPSSHLVKSVEFYASGSGTDTSHDVEIRSAECLNKVKQHLKAKEQQCEDYNSGMMSEVIHLVEKCIQEDMNEFRSEVTTEYRVDLMLSACAIAMKEFLKIHNHLKASNSPVVYMESQREAYFTHFKKHCSGIAAEAIAAELLSLAITEAVVEPIFEVFVQGVAHRMKSNDEALNGNRSKLELCVLKDLLEYNLFPNYISYIQDPRQFISDWITDRVYMYCFKQGALSDECGTILNESFKVYEKIIQKMVQDTTTSEGMQSWVRTFAKSVKDIITLDRSKLIQIEMQDILDVQSFVAALSENLTHAFKQLQDKAKSLKKNEMWEFKQKPQGILLQQLSGCWETCPFCGAVCTNTLPGHVTPHSVPFHRPLAIRGGVWQKTNTFDVSTCSSNVCTKYNFLLPGSSPDKWIPWKSYKEAGLPYSRWSITQDESSENYWKYFICKYKDNLKEHYQLEFKDKGEIPKDWENITGAEALQSLESRM